MVDLLVYAVCAGLLLILATGPLGAIVVWQRMAYYGDTLAHSSLLGVAIGVLMNISIEASVIAICALLALILGPLHRWSGGSIDSLLGIASHGSLAAGLVAVSMQSGKIIDLNAILFGDILAVSGRDLALLGSVTLGSSILLLINWNSLVALAAHRDLAQIEGRRVALLEVLQMLLIAVVVAVGMKIVGVLLISALLIIPAASASRWSRSPEQVAVGAIIVGACSVVGGIASAWWLDTPAGPSIVLFATLLFLIALPTGKYRLGS